MSIVSELTKEMLSDYFSITGRHPSGLSAEEFLAFRKAAAEEASCKTQETVKYAKEEQEHKELKRKVKTPVSAPESLKTGSEKVQRNETVMFQDDEETDIEDAAAPDILGLLKAVE